MSAWFSALPNALTKKSLLILLAIAFGVGAWYFGPTIPVIFAAILWGIFFYFLVAFILNWGKEAGATSFLSSYTTRDVVVMAALIAIGGVAKAYWGQLRLVLEAAFGPYAEFIVGPGFYIWAILACNLVRKPLSGTISMTIGSAVEILAGNPFGLPVFLFNFWEGFGPDISYNMIFRNKRYDIIPAIIGGILSADLGLVYGWVYFGFAKLPIMAFIIYVVEVTLSGVAAGIIGYYLAKALEKIGVKPPAVSVVEED
jgi:ABC-type thiamin/hydroxymethylpyrimidine transport system permease subunit